MGLFRRKSVSTQTDSPLGTKNWLEQLSRYIDEARFVAALFDLNLSYIEQTRIILTFLMNNPSGIAFVITFEDEIHLIQCLDNNSHVDVIPYSEIIEARIIDDFEGPELAADDPEEAQSEVHHLRTPRAAMCLRTKGINATLIATLDQVLFLVGYLQETSKGLAK